MKDMKLPSISKNSLIGDVTPQRMIEVKYDRAKEICISIWDNPDKFYFEDIFHDTILKCLSVLTNEKMPQDYLKAYFFKAFRINMVRHYGYSYNKLKSGNEIEESLLPVENTYETHLDGFGMLDLVEHRHGKELRNMLWDNLQGYTYKDLDKIYHTNTYYWLSKIKTELKQLYLKELYLQEQNEYMEYHR